MRSYLAYRMIINDRSSTAGALLGVVAIVFLVGQQLSILFGLLSFMSVLVDHSEADIWVVSPRTEYADAISDIPARYIDRLEGFPEILTVDPIIIGSALFKRPDGGQEPVRIVGIQRPRMTGGPWSFKKGDITLLAEENVAVVDDIDMNKLGLNKTGVVTEIGNQSIRIEGITRGVRGFQGTIIFTTIETARNIIRMPKGRYSALLIKLKPNISLENALSKLSIALPEAGVFSSKELSLRTRLFYLTNTGIGGSFIFSVSIAALVGIVIIALTLYASILNRISDFAVLRALGARRHDVFVIMISQTMMIALAGLIIGFTFLAIYLNRIHDSAIPCALPGWVAPIHALFTLIFCMLGASIAIRKSLKADPAAVFR